MGNLKERQNNAKTNLFLFFVIYKKEVNNGFIR